MRDDLLVEQAGPRGLQPALHPAGECLNLDELFQWFVKACRSEKLAEVTIYGYELSFKNFKRWLAAHTDVRLVADISKRHLYEFRRHCLDAGNSPNTVRHKTSLIRTVFLRAFNEELIPRYPFIGFRNLRVDEPPLRPVLTMSEMKAISDQIHNPELKLAWDIARFTGMRGADMTRIHMENIDHQRRAVRFWMAKRHRWTVLPLYHKLSERLGEFAGKEGLLFPERKGRKLFSQAFHRQIVLLKGPSFKCAGSHTPRHSFASFLYAQRVRWEDIAFLLGHKIRGVTDRYIRQEDHLEYFREILDGLPLDGH